MSLFSLSVDLFIGEGIQKVIKSYDFKSEKGWKLVY